MRNRLRSNSQTRSQIKCDIWNQLKSRTVEKRIRGRIIGFARLAILTLVWLPWQPADGSDRPIVILQSSKIKPYEIAAKGAIEELGTHPILTYVLDGNPDHTSGVIEQIGMVSPRAVIAIGSLAIFSLKEHPINIPVVSCVVVDHTEALQIPDSWVVSMHLPADEAHNRIVQVLPTSRIGIPYNPLRTGELIKTLVEYFSGTTIHLIPFVVQSPAELSPSIDKIRPQIDALWIVPDSTFLTSNSVKYLLRYSGAQRLPLIAYSEGFTKSGALLSLGGDYEDMGRQAARIAIRVLSGDEPSRIQHPERVVTFINLQVAKALNISVRESLVVLAARVFP